MSSTPVYKKPLTSRNPAVATTGKIHRTKAAVMKKHSKAEQIDCTLVKKSLEKSGLLEDCENLKGKRKTHHTPRIHSGVPMNPNMAKAVDKMKTRIAEIQKKIEEEALKNAQGVK